MGQSEQGTKTLFEELDGPYLVELANWLAQSLDPSELTTEQVLILQMVIERCMNALWQEFPEIFATYFLRLMTRLASVEDDDGDEDEDE